MTVTQLLTNIIEIQCEVIYCYYNYLKDERFIITKEMAANMDIRYIYIENEKLYIEVNNDEECI